MAMSGGGLSALGAPLLDGGHHSDYDYFGSAVVPADVIEVVPLDKGHKKSAESGNTSTLHAYANIVCFSMGAGTLGLSRAVANTSWAGVGLLVVFAILLCFTAVILSKVYLLLRKRGEPCSSYEDIGKVAFGMPGKVFVKGTLYLNQFGIGVLYLILVAGNMNLMLEGKTGKIFPWSKNEERDLKTWVVILAVASLPLCWLRDMKHLSFVSVFGVLTMFGVVVAVLVNGMLNPPDIPQPDYGGVTPLTVAKGFSTLVFAYGGHPVFPTCQVSMKRPDRFPLALILGFFTMCATYLPVAVMGYYQYGNALNDNLLADMPHTLVRTLVIAFLSLSVFFSFPICVFPLFVAVERACHVASPGCRNVLISMVIRTVIVGVTMLVGVMVPFFGAVMGLLGSSTETLLVLVFPSVFYLRINWSKVNWCSVLVHICIVLLGFAAGACGSFTAILSIIDNLKDLHF